eukprot:gene13535-biopygen3666
MKRLVSLSPFVSNRVKANIPRHVHNRPHSKLKNTKAGRFTPYFAHQYYSGCATILTVYTEPVLPEQNGLCEHRALLGQSDTASPTLSTQNLFKRARSHDLCLDRPSALEVTSQRHNLLHTLRGELLQSLLVFVLLVQPWRLSILSDILLQSTE